MISETKPNLLQYFWQVTYAHTIAWFAAGAFAMFFMNYAELFEVPPLSHFMRPTDSPIVSLAMILQMLRGMLIALFILPLRKAFFEENHGLIKLGIITVGFFYVCTFGPGIGSFDGYIFTTLPVFIHLVGLPEMILYVLSFVGILHISHKYAHKKAMTIIPIILITLIGYISISGFMTALNQG